MHLTILVSNQGNTMYHLPTSLITRQRVRSDNFYPAFDLMSFSRRENNKIQIFASYLQASRTLKVNPSLMRYGCGEVSDPTQSALGTHEREDLKSLSVSP